MIGCLAGLWHLYNHFGLPEAGNLGHAASTAFQQNEEEHWERLLNVHGLLRGGWHFDHFILTDGVSTSFTCDLGECGISQPCRVEERRYMIHSKAAQNVSRIPPAPGGAAGGRLEAPPAPSPCRA